MRPEVAIPSRLMVLRENIQVLRTWFSQRMRHAVWVHETDMYGVQMTGTYDASKITSEDGTATSERHMSEMILKYCDAEGRFGLKSDRCYGSRTE